MRRVCAAWAGVLLLAGCDHTPTASWTPEERGPLTADNPRRITYNPGLDSRPAWLPDGSAFFYTFERTGPDRDQCLGLMPEAGGGLHEEVCDRALGGADSITTLQSAAVSPDGQMIYLWSVSPSFAFSPTRQEIRHTTRAHPFAGAGVRAVPYIAPSGNAHLDIEDAAWLAPGKVLYLGMRVEYHVPCQGCRMDTLQAGLEAVVLDVPGGAITTVPGTELASSVALGGADTMYYTVASDSRVWRRVLSSGAVSIAHDFGAARTARDVTVAGNRLVAVIGGNVREVTPDLLRPPMQVDDGGELWLVDLVTGAEAPLLVPSPRWFRRPALAPNGLRLVAEGYPVDTGSVVPGDLWLLDLP